MKSSQNSSPNTEMKPVSAKIVLVLQLVMANIFAPKARLLSRLAGTVIFFNH